MQTLYKYKIECDYSDQYNVGMALKDFGFTPVWNYDTTNENAYTLVDCSYNNECENHNTFMMDFNDYTGGNTVRITPLEEVPLLYNAPSNISMTSTSTTKTITQSVDTVKGDYTYNYTATITFDHSDDTVQYESTSHFYNSQTGATGNTVVTVDPDTGESTSVTEIDNNDGSTSTTTETYNQNGTITGSQTHNENSDGSSSDQNYSYYDDGTMSQSYESTTNTDGSGESHLVNYGENGVPTDAENNWIDTSQNQNTQNIEYDENGNPEVVGYEIDTSNNGGANDGEVISNGGLDTGVLAFDGRDFDVEMTAEIPYYDRSQHNNAQIAPLIVMSSRENGYVQGIVLFQYNPSNKNVYHNFVTNTAVTTSTANVNFFRVQKYNSTGGVDSSSSKTFGHKNYSNY